MDFTQTHYPSSQMDAYLGKDASEEETQQFEAHLEHCEICRSSLHSCAASDVTWDGAQRYLQDDADDLQTFSDAPSPASTCFGYSELLDALAPTDDPRMLGRLGPFEIAGVIGAGGMGVVLKALDQALSRFVALKVLSPHLWKDDQARERFSREARAAASVIHDNVIEIYGVAEADGIPYFTMPYLRGETLQQRIDQRGPLELHEILRIAKQLADGLSAAHAQGLVHRDIKPANVLLTNGAERVHLSDFGLAYSRTDDRLTHSGVLAGTPSFMSPEQVDGQRVDHRSDLFCLGSVIYAMCTGTSPFKAESVIQQLMNVSHASPERLEELNPTIPTWLAAIVDRLHSLSPNDRYQSAAELAEDLERCLAHSQNPDSCLQPRSVARLQSRYVRASKPSKTKARIASIGAIIAVGLIAWFGPGIWGQLSAQASIPITIKGQVVDPDGKPIANAPVLAVQKTWPNNRYQQRPLKTTTDKQGKFQFERFATKGSQYAFLLTALPDGYSMSSRHELVRDGKPHDAVTLRVGPSKPMKIQVNDPDGNPVEGVKILPSTRTTVSGEQHMTYAMQVAEGGKPTDAKGVVMLSGFEVGDKDASVTIDVEGEWSEQNIQIPENRALTLTVTPPKPAGPLVTIMGTVIDVAGNPVKDAKVIVVRKTWPKNRYRQDSLSGQTNQEGVFTFGDFAPSNRQYAFLVTVIEDGYAMTSEYRLVKDGSPQEPITLTVEPSKPIQIQVKDPLGKPVKDVKVLPSSRTTAAGKDHMTYAMQVAKGGKPTDENGVVMLSGFQAGDKDASLTILANGEISEQKFEFPEEHVLAITITPPGPVVLTGPFVNVQGKVVNVSGAPLAYAKVIVVRKTWTNNRYRQEAVTGQTDANGEFKFPKFAQENRQYAFLLTVIEEGYAMTSEYRFVGDGSQQDPVTLTVEPAKPIVFHFRDSKDAAIEGIEVCPNERPSGGDVPYINYQINMKESSKTTDSSGKVTLTAWKPGETGELHYRWKDQVGQHSFQVGDDRKVVITLP